MHEQEIKIQGHGIKSVEGTFDGEDMWGEDGQKYIVPGNYASKSKLVEGDRLKVYIREDGQLIFKQIYPVQRRRLMGWIVLSTNGNKLEGMAEGKRYSLLQSALTFHRAKVGDKVALIIPKYSKPTWAALENIFRENVEKEEEELSI